MLKYLLWPLCLIFAQQAAFAQLPDFTELVKNSGAAVVNISTESEPELNEMPQDPENAPQLDELFRHFFQGPGRGFIPKNPKSLGSGFIISKDGYVLTNHHVVKDADKILVKLTDRREFEAKLIGSDPRSDIALLKVEANQLPVVKIGSAEALDVGEWVLAIGTPFGFEHSVTAGIVSAKGRSLPGDNYVPFIQTDVAINPGNSGGPLFNMDGEVVGVNSQIYTRTGSYAGISFAIPMEVAMNIVKQIKNKGKVSRGWLGVQIQDVTRDLAESFGMDSPHGALVSKVMPDSPAEKAGLKIGDIIVGFNGKDIVTSAELPPLVGITPINEKAKVTVIRLGNKQTITVKIGLLPEPEELQLTGQMPGTSKNDRLGVSVSNLTEEQREQLQVISNGVLVQRVATGPALNAGIQRGDVILRIQNNVIRDVSTFDKIVAELPTGKSVAILIQRRGSPVFLALKISK